MKTDNKIYRISIKALVLNPGRDRFLVIQASCGRWDLLGGGLEHGETDQECLHREVYEEMKIKIRSIAPYPCYFLTGPFQSLERLGKWYANTLYEVELESLDFTPSDECVDIRFVSPEEALELHAFNSVHILARQFQKERHQAA